MISLSWISFKLAIASSFLVLVLAVILRILWNNEFLYSQELQNSLNPIVSKPIKFAAPKKFRSNFILPWPWLDLCSAQFADMEYCASAASMLGRICGSHRKSVGLIETSRNLHKLRRSQCLSRVIICQRRWYYVIIQ